MEKVREGNQSPTFSTVPRIERTDGDMAAALAAEYTCELMEWQRNVLDMMLARDSNDKYAHHAIALSVPRQNGKSEVVRARCLYGLVTVGERILYTCHQGDTSDEMFRAFSTPFEDGEAFPDLHELLKALRKANGQQAIYLKNGGYIRFSTRTNQIARGRSYDVLIYDEAQELTDLQQAASLPTISASRQHNTQTIYLGTPPNADSAGTVFRRLHDTAHSGTSQTPWVEWAADEVGDVTDRERWWRCNPSVGVTIDEEAIEGELSMSPDIFARERLGWWAKRYREDALIDASIWAACGTEDPPEDGIMSVGIKFDREGTRVCIAVALRREPEPDYVELVFDEPSSRGTSWIADWVTERKDRIAGLVVDGQTGAGDLIQKLEQRRFPRKALTKASSRVVSDAAAMTVNAINERELIHWKNEGQGGLDSSAASSAKRRIGDGFGFDGEDATPIEAASLAIYAARTTKRTPGRKGACA